MEIDREKVWVLVKKKVWPGAALDGFETVRLLRVRVTIHVYS